MPGSKRVGWSRRARPDRWLQRPLLIIFTNKFTLRNKFSVEVLEWQPDYSWQRDIQFLFKLITSHDGGRHFSSNRASLPSVVRSATLVCHIEEVSLFSPMVTFRIVQSRELCRTIGRLVVGVQQSYPRLVYEWRNIYKVESGGPSYLNLNHVRESTNLFAYYL